MGGQACILYGAAEFSRDIDLAVLADEKNLSRLQAARPVEREKEIEGDMTSVLGPCSVSSPATVFPRP